MGLPRRSTLPPLVLLLLGVQLGYSTCFSAVERAPHAGATAACARRALSPRAAVEMPVDKLTPLTNHVIVQLQREPDATLSGVLLPSVFDEDDDPNFQAAAFVTPKPRVGTVLAVGPGLLKTDGSRAPMPDIAEGQKVVVGPSLGTRLQEEGRPLRESTLFLFEAEEIWAVC